MNPAEFESMLSMLRDIGFKLDRLERRLAPAAAPAAPEAPKPAPVASAAAFDVADAADLDGPYGDPEIRRDPPRWTGESMVGKRYSECPADYLDNLAGFNAWRAQKDDEQQAVDAKGRPKSHWAKLDAARARGWAQRIRGAQPAVRETARTSSAASRKPYVAQPVEQVESDDVPF